MAKIKYYYDTEKCKYERIKPSRAELMLNSLGMLFIGLLLAIALHLLFNYFFESPKELQLKNRVQELQFYYDQLKKDMAEMTLVLDELEHRDKHIYRAVLGAEPNEKQQQNSIQFRDGKFTSLDYDNLYADNMVSLLNKKISLLKQRLYTESESQVHLLDMAKNKEDRFASIPAIRPIADPSIFSLASGYGMRTHPIMKIRKMHTGIDFSAPRGTPIHATADGRVVKLQTKFTGYGKIIEIEHGLGYKTRYAHLQEFAIKLGQKVKRGDLIGYVGSTGLSTAPHIHYEVLVNNVQVNPIHYILGDISTADYEKLIELASIENQALGM